MKNDPKHIAAFFDLDGTLTSTRVWQGLMDYFRLHGLRRWSHRAFLLYHYPLYFVKRMGLLSEYRFRAPWAAHLGWYFRGFSEAQAGEIWQWVVEQYVSRYWRQDVLRIVKEHQDAGHVVALVSGGPQPLLAQIGKSIGVEIAVGTRFVVDHGVYTGMIEGQTCLGANKVTLARARLLELGLDVDLSASFAYADSITDLPLLEFVGHPVAVYPDRELETLARERGWEVYKALVQETGVQED